jgi:hypothetical protein
MLASVQEKPHLPATRLRQQDVCEIWYSTTGLIRGCHNINLQVKVLVERKYGESGTNVRFWISTG